MLRGRCFCGAVRYERAASPSRETACHTQITFRLSRHPDLIDLTTCSLKDSEQVPPVDHTFDELRLAWVKLADGLPAFPKARPS